MDICVGDTFQNEICFKIEVTELRLAKKTFVGIVYSNKNSRGDLYSEWDFFGNNTQGLSKLSIKSLSVPKIKVAA